MLTTISEEPQTQLEEATDRNPYFLGGPLDGEEVDKDNQLLWVFLPVKNKGLLALYEKRDNKYIYKKTVEGYPDNKKSYGNLIIAGVQQIPEPVGWMEGSWRMWTTKKDF
jgi:hypothetical protein